MPLRRDRFVLQPCGSCDGRAAYTALRKTQTLPWTLVCLIAAEDGTILEPGFWLLATTGNRV